MKQLLTLLFTLIVLSGNAQVKYSGTNTVYTISDKLWKEQPECYIEVMRSMDPNDKVVRFPGGTSSRNINYKRDKYWNDLDNFIDLHVKCDVTTILYVAPVNNIENALKSYRKLAEHFHVIVEFGNEEWLYYSSFVEWFQARLKPVEFFEQKANWYKYKYTDLWLYFKSNGIDLGSSMIWCSPFPNTPHTKAWFDSCEQYFSLSDQKNVSFHLYPDPERLTEYFNDIYGADIPPYMRWWLTEEAPLNFGYDARKGKNTQYAFTKTHQEGKQRMEALKNEPYVAGSFTHFWWSINEENDYGRFITELGCLDRYMIIDAVR